jgi:hypothetical protein
MVEHLTGFKWPKTRPKWLRSPKVRRKSSRGVPLELDGFCEELLAAFEFQGQQHNREVAHFGGRSKYDPLKVRRCRQKRVKLMRPTIEEFEAAEKKGKEALLRWAAGMLTKRGIRLRPGGLKRLIRSFRLKVNSARVEELTKECHEYAAAHEGEFLGKMCLSPTDEHRWLCTTHGKVFKNTLTIMKSAARFCPDCGREDNADAAKGRRQDFPTLSGFRRECRRLGVEHYWQFRQGRNILAFKVSMPKDPMDYYKVTARQLFQKTSPHSEPWQYTDEHDDPADLLSHPNWNVRLLSSGKRRRARRGAAAAAHR